MDTYELTDTGTNYGDGTMKVALRRKDNPEVAICAMRIAEGDMWFWNRLLNSQAYKAWELGAEAMSGQGNGGPMAENPFARGA